MVRSSLDTFDMQDLEALSQDDWESFTRHESVGRRFPKNVAKYLHSAVERIAAEYGGDASEMWSDRPTSARLVRRFLAFPGVGPKIANMAANILVREFKVNVADTRNIDISADVRIQRVMGRLGLADPDNAADVIYAARDVYPAFPGIYDVTLWELGGKICPAGEPKCDQCWLVECCDYAENSSASPSAGPSAPLA